MELFALHSSRHFHLLAPLETVIHQRFLPALTVQVAFNNDIRKLLALPCQLGGLNISDPTQIADFHFHASTQVSATLAALIVAQEQSYSIISDSIRQTKSRLKSRKTSRTTKHSEKSARDSFTVH